MMGTGLKNEFYDFYAGLYDLCYSLRLPRALSPQLVSL